jgi:hypothetical protein
MEMLVDDVEVQPMETEEEPAGVPRSMVARNQLSAESTV